MTLQDEYAHLWGRSRERLRAGTPAVEPPPHEGGDRWGLSVIFRPDDAVGRRLAEAATELRSHAGSGHAYYGTETLHTTVMTVDTYRVHLDANRHVAPYVRLMQNAAEGIPRFRHEYRGLTASASTILAQGFPVGDALSDIRTALCGLLSPGTKESRQEARVRTFAHASLCVFSGPIVAAEGLVSYIENHREHVYGACDVHALELVSYTKTADAISLTSHGIVRLANPA